MARHTYLGSETEFGIVVEGGAADNHWLASSPLLLAYALAELEAGRAVNGLPGSLGADEVGRPRRQGVTPGTAGDGGWANLWLPNGARLYTDHAHPEYSSPECSNALEVVAYDAAGEIIMQRAIDAFAAATGKEVRIYKNNTMGGGMSYGSHENYQLERAKWGDLIVPVVAPQFVTRQLYTGAGKAGFDADVTVGCEALPSAERMRIPFQISQRPDFVTELFGVQTTYNRPLINMRDEPHADHDFIRQHVIIGDANRGQVPTFLKFGVTALVFQMAQDGVLVPLLDKIVLADPVGDFRKVSRDLTMRQPLALAAGGTATALSIQRQLYEAGRAYAQTHSLDGVGGPVVGQMILDRWGATLDALERNPKELVGVLDWVTKRDIIDHYLDSRNLPETSIKAQLVDWSYARVGEKSLARGLEEIVDRATIEAAADTPPDTTRAELRGALVESVDDAHLRVNWGTVCLKTDTGWCFIEVDKVGSKECKEMVGIVKGGATPDQIADGFARRGVVTRPARVQDLTPDVELDPMDRPARTVD